MFSLNSIGYATVRSLLAFWRKYNRQMYGVQRAKSSYRKIWSNILTARWRASAWSDKMNKEQSADDPSVDLIRVKNMLNSTISMSYPDVVIVCIEHKVSLEAFRAIEAALVKHDNNMKDSCGWLITITANHSNYLVCDRANTQSVTVRKVVKLQLNYCNALVIKWIYNIVLFGGKNAGCSFFITFNWCICSLFWRYPDGRLQWPRLRNSWPFLLKSDVNLFNHLVRKADVAGCCSAGSGSSLIWGCPVFSVADLYCLKLFLR